MVKIMVGMLDVLFLLRISGKTQMVQLTPLNSVNTSVLGALVGGAIYSPDVSAWQLVFSSGVWTCFNVGIRYLLRSKTLRRLTEGDTVMIVRNGQINLKEFKRNGLEMEQFRTFLHENGISSMMDVDDVRFETNRQLMVLTHNSKSKSYLSVNSGSVLDSSLESIGKTEEWLKDNPARQGYPDVSELFCVEWTPGRSSYVAKKNSGNGTIGKEENDVCN